MKLKFLMNDNPKEIDVWTFNPLELDNDPSARVSSMSLETEFTPFEDYVRWMYGGNENFGVETLKGLIADLKNWLNIVYDYDLYPEELESKYKYYEGVPFKDFMEEEWFTKLEYMGVDDDPDVFSYLEEHYDKGLTTLRNQNPIQFLDFDSYMATLIENEIVIKDQKRGVYYFNLEADFKPNDVLVDFDGGLEIFYEGEDPIRYVKLRRWLRDKLGFRFNSDYQFTDPNGEYYLVRLFTNIETVTEYGLYKLGELGVTQYDANFIDLTMLGSEALKASKLDYEFTDFGLIIFNN